MKPVRETGLVDLLDRLLNKGLVLDADLIITVAGVPLVGMKLRAILAGMETMLEYGIMDDWDRHTREWYENEVRKAGTVPLVENEEISYRTFGSIWQAQGLIHAWKPGFWHLTNRRLLLWRTEPPEMLFEVSLEKIEGLWVTEQRILEKERHELCLQFDSGKTAYVSVSNSVGFVEALERAVGKFLERRETDPKFNDTDTFAENERKSS